MAFQVRDARVEDAPGIARVESESWRDAYATLLPESYLVATLDPARRRLFWRRRLAVGNGEGRLVATDSAGASAVVGYAVFGRCRNAHLPPGAELYELYLHPDHQGRGLGRRLMTAVAERIDCWGQAALCVEVLEGNPSRFFYEALGGRLAARKSHTFAGQSLPTLVYAWNDLADLIAGDAARGRRGA